MNKVKFLLATLFITLTASLSYAADIKGTDFKKDGISYEINSDGNTVTVLFGPITGNLVIPSTVENNGKTYTITAIAAIRAAFWNIFFSAKAYAAVAAAACF